MWKVGVCGHGRCGGGQAGTARERARLILRKL